IEMVVTHPVNVSASASPCSLCAFCAFSRPTGFSGLIHGDSGLDGVALQIVPNRSGGHQAILDGAGGGATCHGDDRTDELVRARPEVADRVSSGRNSGGDVGASGVAGVIFNGEARRVTVALHDD